MSKLHPYMLEPKYNQANVYLTHTDRLAIKRARAEGKKILEVNGNEIQVDYRPIIKNPRYEDPQRDYDNLVENLLLEKYEKVRMENRYQEQLYPDDPRFKNCFLLKWYKDDPSEHSCRDRNPSENNPAFNRFKVEAKTRGFWDGWMKQIHDHIAKKYPEIIARMQDVEQDVEKSTLPEQMVGQKGFLADLMAD